MDATITQSGALYLLQHKKPESRRGFFQRADNTRVTQAVNGRRNRVVVQPVVRHTDNGR